jgi:hypothetical protein
MVQLIEHTVNDRRPQKGEHLRHQQHADDADAERPAQLRAWPKPVARQPRRAAKMGPASPQTITLRAQSLAKRVRPNKFARTNFA